MSASRCVSSVPHSHSHSHAFSGLLRSSFKPSRFRVSSSRLALASPSRAAGKHDTRVSGVWHGSDKSARRHNKLSQAPRTGNLRTPTNRRTSSRDTVRTRASDSQFLTSTASCVAPIPLEAAFALWSDRRRIPKWMPWVTSVQTGFDDDRLSKWTVSTDTLPKPWDRPLGQRLEYSWYALNSEPVEGDGFRTIAWVADEAAAVAAGTDANARAALVTNKGKVVIRYESPTSCAITLSVSYAAPEALQPMGMALGPVLENILKNDLERFAVYSKKVVKVVE
ncbi:polyketide cyclase domain-containing protein [Pseudoscourfieldia marina]